MRLDDHRYLILEESRSRILKAQLLLGFNFNIHAELTEDECGSDVVCQAFFLLERAEALLKKRQEE